MIDYRATLSPTKARALPLNSKERSIASHALRQAWHFIFDYCPLLLATYPPSGKDFLDIFLDGLERNNIALNWKVYFHIIALLKQNGSLTKELCSELLMAAAIRWTIADFTTCQSIYIVENMFGISILGQKAEGLDKEKVFKLFLHKKTEMTEDIFYSVSIYRTPEKHEDWELFNND